MSSAYRIGIVGATGAVGQELLTLLRERSFPAAEVCLFASARSVGRTYAHGSQSLTVQEAVPEAIASQCDVAIFSAGGAISRDMASAVAGLGCVVIDNSSAFRLDPEVPLVVPEINPEALRSHRGIIANPNCSTAIALMGLFPMHRAFGLKRFVAATYQAVSGAGSEGVVELDQQVRALIEGREYQRSVFPHPIAFNLFPHVDQFLEDGYSREEMKMTLESRKILGLPELRVSCTCVRVPVFRAHSVAVHAEFERPVGVDAARRAVAAFPGSELNDNPGKNLYPTPLAYSRKVNCGVGRIRVDQALDNGLAFWVTGDQLWKGAALNALQIAERLIADGLLLAKNAGS